jgi:Mg-chelatase subunit ChlD
VRPWRSPAGERIPLADAVDLRRELRRARAVQVALATALLALASTAVVVAARGAERPARFLPPGASGIIVVDVSASIRPEGYAHIARTLREAAASGERYGLILFSDTAYEALPPGTRSAELRPFARAFAVDAPSGDGPDALGGLFGRPHPWRAQFTGGTRLSSGLRLARSLLERDRIEDGAVLLVSDLATDTSDLPRLSRTLIDY